MARVLAGAIAVAIVGTVGLSGAVGVSAADDETTYQVGGAKVPDIPWYDYTYRAGNGYFPDATRVLVDYPAGMIPGQLVSALPGADPNAPPLGPSVKIGSDNLDAAIRDNGGRGVPVGLSEGALVSGAERARLANDPTAPPPDGLSFAVFGDPAGRHAFGQSFMTTMFPVGTFLPILDYTVPAKVDSQYDTTSVVAAYDGLADFPDRPSPLAILNALVGAAVVHTPTAFSKPDIVPPGNIVTAINSRGAKETTYFVPNRGLPLTMPFRLLGAAPDVMDDIDATLKPMIDAGYSRNDNPATRPITVDLASGLDPFDTFDSSTRADVENFLQQFRNMSVAPPNVDGLVQQAQNLMPALPAMPAFPALPNY